MRSSRLKLVGILALLVAFMFTMAACDMFDSGVEDPEEDAHGVRITVNPSGDVVEVLSDEVGVLTVEEKVNIDDDVVVELYNEGESPEEDDPVYEEKESWADFDTEYEVTFIDVEPGDYEVYAKLTGTLRDEKNNGNTLYESELETITVEADTITDDVEVTVVPLEWSSLEVTLKDNSDEEDIVDRLESIQLKHPAIDENEETKDNGWEDGNTVTFVADDVDNAIPARWHLFLEFEEGVGSPDAIEILLLPTEEREIDLDIDYTRGIVDNVTVDVHGSPDAPSDVKFDYGVPELKWNYNGDADKFTILRSEEETLADADFYEVVEDDVDESPFDMTDQEEGYYYWVRAYDEDGYSSDIEGTERKYGEVTNEEELETALAQESISTIIVGEHESEDAYEGVFEVTNEQKIMAASNPMPKIEGGFEVFADNVTISGLEVEGTDTIAGSDVAIYLNTSATNFRLENSRVITEDVFQGDGIETRSGGAYNLVLYNNTFESPAVDTGNARRHVFVNDAASVEIIDNVFTGDNLANGLALGITAANEEVDGEIRGNTFDVGTDYGQLDVQADNIDVVDNTFDGQELGSDAFYVSSELLDLGDVLTYNTFDPEAMGVDDKIIPEDSINSAIDAANERVFVGPGTFTEKVRIEVEGLTLRSVNGPEVTTIDGGGEDRAVRISADSVTFEGFTVTGFKHYGILAGDPAATSDFHRNDVTIRNNIIPENVDLSGTQPAAVYLPAVDGALVENNELGGQEDGWALDASKSRDVVVNNNRIFQENSSITVHAGIFMDGETFEGIGGHEITGNTIEGFSKGNGRGIRLMAYFGPIKDITIQKNQIQNNVRGIGVEVNADEITDVIANKNNIVDNGVGVYTDADAEEVDATENYWEGNDDKYEGNVDVSSELDEPVEDAGADL